MAPADGHEGDSARGLNDPQPAERGSGSALDDLAVLLTVKAEELDRLTNKAAAFHNMTEYGRLSGKAEGVRLALSFVEEYRHGGR